MCITGESKSKTQEGLYRKKCRLSGLTCCCRQEGGTGFECTRPKMVGSTTRRGKQGGEVVFRRHILNLALDEKWQEDTRHQKKMRKKCFQAAGKTRTRVRPYIRTTHHRRGNYLNG